MSTPQHSTSPETKPEQELSASDVILEAIQGDDAVLGAVLERYESAKRAQQTVFDLFKKLYQLFRFYKAAGSAIKVFNPVGYALVVGILSKVFVRSPKVMAMARQGGAYLQSKLVSGLLDYQFANPESPDPLDEQFLSFLTELCVCGTAVGKVMWQTEWITTFEEQPQMDKQGNPIYGKDGMPVIDRVKVPKKGFDDPVFEHIPIEHFYIQPGATSIKRAKWVIFEKWVDYSELLEKQEAGIYKNVEALSPSPEGHDQSGIESSRQVKNGAQTSERYKGKYHLLEYWEDDRVIVVCGKTTVLRDEANPDNHGRKPFVAMPYTRVPHEFYGIGALEPVQDLQKAVNVALTQRLEYVAQLLNLQYGVLNGRNVDEEAIIDGYPVVHMDSPDAITPLRKDPIANASFVTTNDLLGDMERAMGISGYDLGTPNAAQDKTRGTKGGVQAILSEAQTRFTLILKRFEQNILAEVAKLFLSLDIQYFSSIEEKLIFISDDQGQSPTPITRDILKSADWLISIVPGSTGALDKQSKLDNFMAWVDMSSKLIPNFDKQLAVVEAGKLQEVERPERFIQQANPADAPTDRPSLNISFRDLPLQGQIQMAKLAGIDLTPADILASSLHQSQPTGAPSPTPNQAPAAMFPRGMMSTNPMQ